MKALGVLVAACALTACTSVKMVQRDNCWVKQIEKWPNRVMEEIGPCGRADPKWSEDRLTRIVQECVAEADHQWHNRAMAAWSRGEPIPERDSEQRILESCYANTTEIMLSENNAANSALKEQVEDARADREYLRNYTGTLAEALGEAAKKPAPSAVATATARGDGNGTANTDSNSRTVTESNHSSALGEERHPARRTAPKPPESAPLAAKPQCPAPTEAALKVADKAPITPALPVPQKAEAELDCVPAPVEATTDAPSGATGR